MISRPKMSNMKRHMKRKHDMDGDLNFQRGKCLCLDCGRHFYRIKDLRDHLSTEHGLEFKTETLSMQNISGNVIISILLQPFNRFISTHVNWLRSNTLLRS